MFSVLRLVRLRPFDVSTPQGRADERYRRSALTTITMGLAKVVSVAAALVSVPLTLHYLGTERYGMWMTMSSVIAMLNFVDFGIGNGILNAVSTAYGREQHDRIAEHVSSGFAILTLVAIAIIALFGLSVTFVPWDKVFNVASPAARADVVPALMALVLCFAATIPLTIVQRVQFGLQMGFVASLWQCLGSLLGLGGVILAISLEASLPLLVLALTGTPLLAALLNTALFFGHTAPRYAPRLSIVSRHSVAQVTHVGFLFLILQVVGAVIYLSDNIIIAQLMGAAAVTDYAVPQRLFTVVALVLSMALSPLWPAYGEAIARGDEHWVRRTLMRSFFASIGLAGFLSLALVVSGNWLIDKWVGNSVAVSLLLLVGLGVWQVVQAGGAAISMYLNGANVMKFQAAIGVVTAAVAIVLKVYLVQSIGVSGVVWATVVAYLLFTGLPTYWYLHKRALVAQPA